MTDPTNPVVTSFNTLAPILIQDYESYLPTAFDENLTLLQKVNMIIQNITTSNTTVNNLINEWNTQIVPYVNGDGFQTDVNNKLDAMANDGTLANIINVSMIGTLANLTTAKTDNLVDAINDNHSQIIETGGYGVINGVDVVAQATPNMSVLVNSGAIHLANGKRYSISEINSLAVTSADATQNRTDIVYVSGSGVVTYLAGALGSGVPATPTDGFKLCEITVNAGVTSITASNIKDTRLLKYNNNVLETHVKDLSINVKTYGAKGDGVTDDTQAFLNAIADCPTGGIIYVPVGLYELSSHLIINKQLKFKGTSIQDDTQNSVPLTGSVLQFNLANNGEFGIRIVADGVEMENIMIQNTSSTKGNAVIGLEIMPVFGGVIWNINIKRVWVKGFATHNIYGEGLLLSTFEQVYSSDSTGNGFYFDNASGNNGTSVNLKNCWSLRNTGYGYYFNTYYYSSLDACASDSNVNSYFFTNCHTISLKSCGSENPTKTHYYMTDCFDMTLESCFGTNGNTGGSADQEVTFLLCSPTCKNITLIGCKETAPNTATLYSVSIGSGIITIINCDFPKNVAMNGTTYTINPDTSYIPNLPFQAPLPQTGTSGGIGNFQSINVASGNGYTLPSGGNWLYFFNLYTSGSYSSTASNIAAGGTLLINGVANQTASGFCWRIS